MTVLRRWKLTIKDKATGNVATYYEWGTTAQDAYIRAIKDDEADAIPTNNYQLIDATNNWKPSINEFENASSNE